MTLRDPDRGCNRDLSPIEGQGTDASPENETEFCTAGIADLTILLRCSFHADAVAGTGLSLRTRFPNRAVVNRVKERTVGPVLVCILLGRDGGETSTSFAHYSRNYGVSSNTTP